jgi:hypothetical protein
MLALRGLSKSPRGAHESRQQLPVPSVGVTLHHREGLARSLDRRVRIDERPQQYVVEGCQCCLDRAMFGAQLV